MNNHFFTELRKQLQLIRAESFFVDCLKLAQTDDQIKSAVKMILDQAKDNRPAVARQIGEGLLNEIEKYALYC